MANGYDTPAIGDFGELLRILKELQAEVKEIGRPTGSQTAQALKTLTDLVNGLLNQVNGNFTGYVAAGTYMTAGATITAQGRITGVAGMSSVGVYNQLLTYGGLYNSQYVHQDGTMGYVPSSRRFKQDIEPFEIELETLRKLRVVQFRYIAAVENLGDAAAVEVGMIAEEVHDLGITWLVDYDDEGTVVGLKRELFGLLALMWVQALDAKLLQPQNDASPSQ